MNLYFEAGQTVVLWRVVGDAMFFFQIDLPAFAAGTVLEVWMFFFLIMDSFAYVEGVSFLLGN